MPHRPFAILLSQLVLLALVGASVAEAQTAPTLRSSVSRKVQGGLSFDVALPLAGGSGIEPRAGNSLIVVLSFDQPISSANVALTAGQGTISGAPAISGNTVTVNLTNVVNAQELQLS